MSTGTVLAVLAAALGLAACRSGGGEPGGEKETAGTPSAAAPSRAPTEALAAKPTEPPAAYRDALARGRTLQRGGQHDLAAKAFAAALEVVPGDAAALSELGWALFRAGDFRAAQKATDEAIAAAKEPPLQAASLYNLGRIREARGERDAAIEAYRKSLALRSNRIVAARLAGIEKGPAAGAAIDALASSPLEGPFPSLADYCASGGRPGSKLGDGPPTEVCDPDATEDPVHGTRELAAPAQPWLAARVFFDRGLDDLAAGCSLGLQTKAGWYVVELEDECYGRGRYYRSTSIEELAARQLVPGGAPEIVIRLRYETSDPMDDGLYTTSGESLVVCGFDVSGAPGCTAVVPLSASNNQSRKRDRWRLSPVFGADGQLELKLEGRRAAVSEEAAPFIGVHRLDLGG